MQEKKYEILQEKTSLNRKREYQSWIWNAGLACEIILGILCAMQQIWGTEKPAWVSLFFVAGIGIFFSALASFLREKIPLAWSVKILPWIFLVVYTRGYGYWIGFRIWINAMLSQWNMVHEGGLALFVVEPTQAAIQSFSWVLVLLSVQIIWKFLFQNRKVAICLLCIAWMLLLLLCESFSPIACSLFSIGILSVCILGKYQTITLPCIVWTTIVAAILGGYAFLGVQEDVSWMSQIRSDGKQWLHDIRYGEEMLPEGDLRLANKLKASTEKMLYVQEAGEKNLYLRGFVGGCYENGRWKELPNSAYAGENTGILQWLKQKGLDPLTQVARYYQLEEEEMQPASNQVEIETVHAARDYVYAPSSVEQIREAMASGEKKEIRFTGRGLWGARRYSFQEYSEYYPTELITLASWISQPKTDAQREYCEAETVYRDFVYKQYTQVDDAVAGLIYELFWQEDSSEGKGLYHAVDRIREVLRNRVTYVQKPEAAPEGEDPIVWFLTEVPRGNAMLYATAAVEAFRAYGIPARYVEGYYLSSEHIKTEKKDVVALTGQDAHAWVEVYFDGIGWLPVDVTPGYYYNTIALQQMIQIPETIQKTAALGEEDSAANPMAPIQETGKKFLLEHIVDTMRDFASAKRGVLAMILMVLVGIGCCLEVMRIACLKRIQRYFRDRASKERARWLGNIIFCFLQWLGIEAYFSWNIEETDALLAKRFSEITEGEYSRVCALLEKVMYGDCGLEIYEERTLQHFLLKLMQEGKNGDWKQRCRFRYACFKFYPK